MKTFILGYVDHDMFCYDSNMGFVINAENEKEARELAQSQICDERGHKDDFWVNPSFSKCEELKLNKGIVLTDFHEG